MKTQIPHEGGHHATDSDTTWRRSQYIFNQNESTNGTASVNSTDKTWTYKPNANFTGDDYFTLQVKDGVGNITAHAMNINVKPVNDLIVQTQILTIPMQALTK